MPMVIQRPATVVGADVEFSTDTLRIKILTRFPCIPTVLAMQGVDLPIGVSERSVYIRILRTI